MRPIPSMWIATFLSLVVVEAFATDALQVPASIQSQLAAKDIVLAMKGAKPLGGATAGTVIVVRHSVEDSQQGSPCELVVIKGDDGKIAASEKNGKIVDCAYNDTNKHADPLGANRNLNVTPSEIAFFNEQPRGGTTYTFAWSNEKSAWHLQHVEASSVENGESGVIVRKSVLDYPTSLPWISLTDFDPKLIRESLTRNRQIVR